MGRVSDDVAALQRILAELAGSSAKDADLLLMQLAPQTARLLELCAIPHVFDESLVHVLDPAAPPELVAELITELPSLPAIRQTADYFALHDLVREQMFERWLGAERRDEFSAVSRRLVEHFSRSPSVIDEQAEANASIVVFHKLGIDVESGFAAFRALYRDFRSASRYSAADALVRLVGEYRRVLPPAEMAWLTYCEAESAADSRNPARAAALLDELMKQDLPGELSLRVRVRLAAALRAMNRFEDAETQAEQALRLSSSEREARPLLHLAYQELGSIARQRGDLDAAELNLGKAIALARESGDRLAVARAYDSLGMMFLRVAPWRAIEMHESCIAYLDRQTDAVRMAQVLNNLGMAYANVGNWVKSRDSYERSLEIKRAAADLYGMALTQLNIARVHQAQGNRGAVRNALDESAALFEAVHDLARAATAHREAARMARLAGEASEAAEQARIAITLLRRADRPEEAVELEKELAAQPTRQRGWRLWWWSRTG